MAVKERKAIKSFEDRFLERLEKLCDGQDIAISNADMRNSLNWADDRYDKVKASLLARKQIKPAPVTAARSGSLPSRSTWPLSRRSRSSCPTATATKS